MKKLNFLWLFFFSGLAMSADMVNEQKIKEKVERYNRNHYCYNPVKVIATQSLYVAWAEGEKTLFVWTMDGIVPEDRISFDSEIKTVDVTDGKVKVTTADQKTITSDIVSLEMMKVISNSYSRSSVLCDVKYKSPQGTYVITLDKHGAKLFSCIEKSQSDGAFWVKGYGDSSVDNVRFTDDEKRVYFDMQDGSTREISIVDHALYQKINRSSPQAFSFKAQTQQNIVVTLTPAGNLGLWDKDGNRIANFSRLFSRTNEILAFHVNKEENKIIVVERTGKKEIDIFPNDVLSTMNEAYRRGSYYITAWAENNDRYITIDSSSALKFWEQGPTGLVSKVISSFVDLSYADTLAFSADGRKAIVGSKEYPLMQ